MKSRVSNTRLGGGEVRGGTAPPQWDMMDGGLPEGGRLGQGSEKVPVRAGPLVPSPFLHNEDPASTGQARAG